MRCIVLFEIIFKLIFLQVFKSLPFQHLTVCHIFEDSGGTPLKYGDASAIVDELNILHGFYEK